MKITIYHAALFLGLVFQLKNRAYGNSSSGNDSCACDCNKTVVVCYFTNWAVYRTGKASFTPDDIDPTLCTHILYAFASLDNDTLTMKMSDSNADQDRDFYSQVTAFVAKGVSVILSIGGWNDSAGDKFSRLCGNATARKKFVDYAAVYLKKYNFSGLDLDIEYPGCPQGDCSQGTASDKENFALLVKELSECFKPKGLLLTAAVAPGAKYLNTSYDAATLGEHFDMIFLMNYDINTYSGGYTGPNSPMAGEDGVIETSKNWVKAGVPSCKLVIGVPMYGHTFLLQNSTLHGFGAPTTGAGPAYPYTQSAGTISYYEMAEALKSGNWTTEHCIENGTYHYSGDQWVSCPDSYDIEQRVKFLKENCYRGAMIWALDLDDFCNMTGSGSYPLLKALNKIRT